MIYDASSLRRKNVQPGKRLWAVAYETNRENTRVNQFVKPVFGELTTTNDKLTASQAHTGRIEYFVPCGKNDRLCFSKAAKISTRVYADTEHEARMLFNILVQKQIQELRHTAALMESDLLQETPVPNNMTDDFLTHVLPHLKYNDPRKPAAAIPETWMCCGANTVANGMFDVENGTVTFKTPDGDFAFPFDFINTIPTMYVFPVYKKRQES